MHSGRLRKLLSGLRSGLRGILRAPLVFGLSVATMAAGLLLLAAYLLVLDNMRQVLDRQGAGLLVVAFVSAGQEPDAAARAALLSRLEADPAVEGLRYVSSEAALGRLRASLGGDAAVLEALAGNPLPASFELEVVAGQRSPDGLRALAGRVAALPGIDDVRYGEAWVEGYARLLGALEWVGIGFGACLALVLGVIVAGTVRLGLHVRTDEIQIQRLVGASGLYVRFPLFVEAGLQGALGATLAVVLLWLLFRLAASLVEAPLQLLLGSTEPSFFGSLEVIALVVLGTALGVASAALSLLRLEEAR